MKTRYLVAIGIPGRAGWVWAGKDSRGKGWFRTGAPAEQTGLWRVVEQFVEWSNDDGNIRDHIVAYGLSLEQAVKYLQC